MKHKYTPGPLVVDGLGIDSKGFNIAEILESKDMDGNKMSREEAEANANLFAAAPDQDRTLRAIVARIEGNFDNPDLLSMGSLGDEQADILSWAKYAIKKAEGES